MRLASTLPVMVAVVFERQTKGGRTVMGNSAEDCAARLTEEGADAIGANCESVAPHQMARIVEILAQSSPLPVIAEPNAGKPRLQDGVTVFDMGASEFAHGVEACVEAGARIVGGCCGTTPEHIEAVTRAVAGRDG